MNHSQTDFVRRPPRGLVADLGRLGSRGLQVVDEPVDRYVVMALEERMWRDRREVFSRQVPADPSAVGRLRARLRDFLIRMQLGPVADAAAGRDPETRF